MEQKNSVVKNCITLFAILLLFAVFAGEFGCRRRALISQPENFKYLEGVRKQIHKNAVRRVVKNIPLLSYFAEHIISTDIFLKLFFQSFSLRAFIDRIRYKMAVRGSVL